jgi:ADP-heptose:LPS heptosyltransferase/GT2 family glycosyltransferase
VDDGSDKFHIDRWEKDNYLEHIIKEIRKNHKVEIISSPKTGRIGASFQAGYLLVSEKWNNPLFMRCDDDVVLEPDYIEKLIPLFDDETVGGVSGLCLDPGKDIQYIPAGDQRYNLWGKVDTITNSPNIQWFRHERSEPFEVEFFHSTQILRMSCLKQIGGFDTNLFANYREENQLSWRIHVEGYKLLVNPQAEMWHLKAPSGGNRGQNTWVDDCRKFSLTKKTMQPGIHINLTHAIGDVIAATPAIAELRQKYLDRNVTIWHPYAKHVFEANPNIDYICTSVFDGQRTMRFEESVYGWMARNNWTGHIANAYAKIFGVPEIDNPIPQLYGIEPADWLQNYVVIMPGSNAKIYDFSDYSRTKCWDNANWEQLVEWLKTEYGVEVIQLSGKEVPDAISNARLVNDLEYRDSFRVIAGARALISIDTMGAHVSAALDIPSVVLWGRTDPSVYGYTKNNIVNLSRQCPKQKPCQGGNDYQQDRSSCPIAGHPCMAHDIDEVQSAIRSVMK